MFFIRYSGTLPFWAQAALGVLLLAGLPMAFGLGTHRPGPQAEEFAALHQQQCLLQGGAQGAEVCAMRTVALASQLYGMDFADEVAQALQ